MMIPMVVRVHSDQDPLPPWDPGPPRLATRSPSNLLSLRGPQHVLISCGAVPGHLSPLAAGPDDGPDPPPGPGRGEGLLFTIVSTGSCDQRRSPLVHEDYRHKVIEWCCYQKGRSTGAERY